MARIAASIGTVADSYDNAMAEALNETFKAELVTLHGPWRTCAELETAIINWIYWYNERRLHGQIGDMPPAEYEHRWYTCSQPTLAGSNQPALHRTRGGSRSRVELVLAAERGTLAGFDPRAIDSR